MEPSGYGKNRLTDLPISETKESSYRKVEATQDQFTQKRDQLGNILLQLDAIVTEIQNHIAQTAINDASKEISTCIENYSKTLRDAKPLLDNLTALAAEIKDDKSRTLEFQKRNNNVETMKKQLQSIMQRFDQLKEGLTKMNHDKIKRTLDVNGISNTDEEIDDMMAKGDYSAFEAVNEVVKKREALQAIEERHNVLLKLESTINDLSSLFCELHLKIAENQETLQTIEVNYEAAQEYTKEATGELTKATGYRLSALKKKIICGVILLVVIVVIIIIIVVTQTTK